jgi:multiple sugar transport system permease protein
MHRSYYWLITALSIPAFLWLIPTIWMVSLSFQPNEVLARTTSTTAFGLIPCHSPPKTTPRSSVSDRRRCGF